MNQLRSFAIIFVLLFIPHFIFSQNNMSNIVIEPMTIADLGGIQSYSFGQWDNKWLIVGGRLDGLHRRQPFASFDIAGHNTLLIVVDPINKKKWTASISSLSNTLQEQLKSTNMQFYQEGKFLYLTGGYGYSDIQKDHTTFSNLTAIDVSETINAIISGKSFTSFFRQITDSKLQVTGGRLEKIGNTYYLVGGNKFIGRYNPMGPNNGPGFIQEYTEQVKKFQIVDNGTSLTINHLPSYLDADNLHRRDLNVAPQIMPNGDESIMAFSGVFQKTIDLPFTNCVHIDSNKHYVINNFNQYYNHYHCAHIPIFSSKYKEMNTLFFGGIAQYYDSAGVMVQNNDVPFVKTIARVSRDSVGEMKEFKLPIQMPSLLGAGSEFIPNENLPRFSNRVFKYDEFSDKDSILLGYIYGGISSKEANIFFINDGTQSNASSQIFKVFLLKKSATNAIDILNTESIGKLQLRVYPIPSRGEFTVRYYLAKKSDVTYTLYTIDGREIEKLVFPNQSQGEHTYAKKISEIENGGIFILKLDTGYDSVIRKIVIEL
jgi:hypothetical protein